MSQHQSSVSSGTGGGAPLHASQQFGTLVSGGAQVLAGSRIGSSGGLISLVPLSAAPSGVSVGVQRLLQGSTIAGTVTQIGGMLNLESAILFAL